jgi:hypothetical protein
MQRAKTRKRPCKICRRWFLPDPRQEERHKTCGRPECQRELHRRQCQKWNWKNTAYFKGIYLAEKLERTKDPPNPAEKKPTPIVAKSRIDLGLPRDVLVDHVGSERLVILDYIVEQIIRRNSSLSPRIPP